MALGTKARDHIFFDFEYRRDGQQLVLCCILNDTTRERVVVDLRTPAGLVMLRALMVHWGDAVWFSYAAMAELLACLTAGVDVSRMSIVCLAAEARQITGSKAGMHVPIQATNLLTTLKAFGIHTNVTPAYKDRMRDLILDNETYTDEQWAEIVSYGWSDVDPLPALWQSIQDVHYHSGSNYSLDVALFHGEALIAQAILEHRSKGFPINLALLNRLYDNRPLVGRELARAANEKLGGEVWQYHKQTDSYHFFFKGLMNYIETLPESLRPDYWALTAKGRPKTDGKFLEELCAKHPHFEPLHTTLNLLHQLSPRGVDLRTLVKDGFIRGLSLPYHAITGRMQPKVSGGFILNMAPFLRSLVCAEPGHVLLMADWSQQEIVIAAAMSGDEKLRQALETGDVYLALAKMAGACPQDATKKSHRVVREMYKSIQLALGYGMGSEALGYRMYYDLRDRGILDVSLAECAAKAIEIRDWHKRTFVTFWEWMAEVIYTAQHTGFIQTLDRWTMFTNLNTPPTRLGNFPMQGNGATILREALKLLAKLPELNYVCTLHDAVMVYCREDQQKAHTKLLEDCMMQATRNVLQFAPNPMDIRIETKTYTHATGYLDDRDTTTLPLILAMLDKAGK